MKVKEEEEEDGERREEEETSRRGMKYLEGDSIRRPINVKGEERMRWGERERERERERENANCRKSN